MTDTRLLICCAGKRKAAAKQKDQDQTGVPREETAAEYPLPADASDFLVAPTAPMTSPTAFSDFNPSSIAEFMPFPATCIPSSSRAPVQAAQTDIYNASFPWSSSVSPDSFPLADSGLADRSWIPLDQYNSSKAYMTDVVVSVFLIPLNMDRSSVRPTSLQKSVPHESWIDSVPFPKLRDNLIMYQDVYNTTEFYNDIANGGSQGYQDDEVDMVLCDPWGEEGWEMSEGFVRKWGPLLEGCEMLVRVTQV